MPCSMFFTLDEQNNTAMFITDDILSLRIAEPEDAQRIYEWENDRSIWRVSETCSPTSRFQIEQFLLGNSDIIANRQMRLMIDMVSEKTPIGCVDIFDYDPIHQRAGLGILIESEHRLHGYAKRAIKMAMDYLFNDVMLHQVHCLIDATNTGSQRLFQDLGFQCTGRKKDWIKSPEGYIDALFYQFINTPSQEAL